MKKFNIVYWIEIPIIIVMWIGFAYIFNDEKFVIISAMITTIILYLVLNSIDKSKKKAIEEGYSVERISKKYPTEKKRILELMEEYNYFSNKHEKAISEAVSILNVENSKIAIDDFNLFKDKVENEKFTLNITKNIYLDLLELIENRLEHLGELCENDRNLLGEIIEIDEEELEEKIIQTLI